MRITAFIGVALVGLFLPLWASVLAALLYALWKPGYELIVLGALIDAQFAPVGTHFIYLYTYAFAGVVLVTNLLKPHLAIYNQ